MALPVAIEITELEPTTYRRKNLYVPNRKKGKGLYNSRASSDRVISLVIKEPDVPEDVKRVATTSYDKIAFEKLSEADREAWEALAKRVRKVEKTFKHLPTMR
jgi:hypothetical protein